MGAEVQAAGTHFRVWAPSHRRVDVVFDDGSIAPLVDEGNEYFSALVATRGAGDRYRLSVDGGEPHADPASRFQPDGPHGSSAIVDPSTFVWTDETWTGLDPHALVVEEIHIGTFTFEGTWRAAARQLGVLAALGITCVEVMPVADFAGTFGWGYDGVNFFAPSRLYGTPDDFRAFVDAAHEHGLAVVLDVVYNHAGPDGCFLQTFSPCYFGSAATDWGSAVNFDGPGSAGVRAFVTANAAYWIREFHIDGLRLDAMQALHDRSTPHIIADIVTAVRTAAGARRTWIVGEDEPQRARIVRPPAGGGLGVDAVWNDDFHHTAMVAATGAREAYYTDYAGSPQEMISAARRGFLYQGQWYVWQQRARGTSTEGLPASAFVAFLQNHDQVGNSAQGLRLHHIATPGMTRALTALLLLGPWTPLLFQGQESGADTPFLYFADHRGALAESVCRGRHDFLTQFPSIAEAARRAPLPDPCDATTFERCKLEWRDTPEGLAWRALHASLLYLRRSAPAFDAAPRACEGAVLAARALVLRFAAARPEDVCLLLVNLGDAIALPILPEPLLAPPAGHTWRVSWSSEDEAFGGSGETAEVGPAPWRLPAESAFVLAAQRAGDPDADD